MKKKIASLTIIIVVLFSTGFAQKIEVLSGSVSNLKNQKIINLEYDYKDLLVGEKAESVYIQEKVEVYNKKEAGKGDIWGESMV